MAKATTTVTHPDGTVSKRTSVRASYAFAVEFGPVNPVVRAAHLRGLAASVRAEIVQIEAALVDPKARIRDRGFSRFSDAPSYHSHEAFLVGPMTESIRRGVRAYPTFTTHCSSDGMTEAYGHDADGGMLRDPSGEYIRFEVDALTYLVEYAQRSLVERKSTAAKFEAEAAEWEAGTKTDNKYGVVRWSRTRELAAKAADGEFSYLSETGHQVNIVPVEVH